MKKVIKYKYQEHEGFLSVVEKSNLYYALAKKDAPKIASIVEKHQLLISYELKQPHYQEVSVRVLFDQESVTWVYHALASENNLYFKELDDSLCVLEIAK